MSFWLDCLYFAVAIFCSVGILIRVRDGGDGRDVLELVALIAITSLTVNAWLA